MPELPEVETVVRDLRPRVVGRLLSQVRLVSPLMAPGFPVGDLEGRTFVEIERRGKWMLFRLSEGPTLVIHLGMSGRLEVTTSASPLLPHTHLRLALDDGGEELRFRDPRRFGRIQAIASDDEAPAGLRGLGPEPASVTVAELARSLGKSRRRLKAALLDQRVVAGIGNIYADEILFAARLHPGTLALSLTSEEIGRLRVAIRDVLRRAIKHRGTTVRDYVTGAGTPGTHQSRLFAYGRSGEPCKICSTPIALDRTIVAGRATHWCPHCQPIPRVAF